jgi:mono/diheme cytochrome c family protein
VEALAHCGGCHTPRNALGAEKKSERFAGGEAEGWTAYALNHASPAPVPWDRDSLYFYLRNGWHEAHGLARGPMAPVVDNLSSVADSEVRAIAAYMAGVMGEPSPERRRQGEALLAQARNVAPSDNLLGANSEGTTGEVGSGVGLGGMVYSATCANCHEGDRPLPFGGIHLALSTGVHGPNPHNLINVILSGLPAADGERSPIMPGFSAALDDGQMIELIAYLRSRFGDKPQWSGIANDIRAARSGGRPIGLYPSPATGTPADASQQEQP